MAPFIGDTRLAGARLISLRITDAFIVNPNFGHTEFRNVTFREARVYRTESGMQSSPLTLDDLRGARLINVQID